jgi:RNA polymerase sigma-70 factor, ECF subfamily
MRAFERRDIPALISLIHQDAVMTMPPDPAWFEGRAAIVEFLDRWVFGVRPRLRTLPTSANGQPGLFIYEAARDSAPYRPLAVQVLTISGSLISDITGFVDSTLTGLFGVPEALSRIR